MSKLLYIYERDMPTVSIMRNIMTNIKEYPEIKSDFIYLSDVTSLDIDSHDVIVFIRPDNSYAWKIASYAAGAGHFIITFCDDDLLNLPHGIPTIPWRKKGLIKTLEQSDVVWSSSRYIVDKYNTYTRGKRTAISDTIVDKEDLNDLIIDKRQKEDLVKIVYAAAPSHSRLFETFISPIVPKLSERYGNKISFTFVGVHPDVPPGTKCEYIPGMPLLEYRKYMKNSHFDIGVAPLMDDDFSRCKYFNKFLEYTTQGILGVYSNTEPYTLVIENNVNGLLADNIPESWLSVLCRAIDDGALRKECLKNAVEYISEKHSEKACFDSLIRDIPELIEKEKRYHRCKSFRRFKVLYCFTRPMDWIYLFAFYLKKDGFIAVLDRTRQHFFQIRAYSRRKD